jgi:DNA-binding transcriptional MerR regulator
VLRIGEVAARAGVSVRALRYYEEQGLLEAERTASGQRRYAESAVGRVRFIQQMYAAGLGSADVLEVLPCVHTGQATPEMIARLVEQRDGIDRQIAELAQARERLDEIIRIGRDHVPAETAVA